MTQITEYNTHSRHNTLEELQRLAKQIFDFGKITGTNHFSYTTTNPDQGGSHEEPAAIEDGGICYKIEAEGFPAKYYVNMSGFTVTNITEEITR